jgi:aminoglycoside 6-adenylyltransferase
VRTESEVLGQFGSWAEAHDGIRAAVLTSSRVGGNSEVDVLSDYDIELYVSDLETFRESDEWLEAFGPVMVRWPLRPRSTFDEAWLTRLVLFDDGVRIDFQVTAQREVAPDAYEHGHRVLIDKDGLMKGLRGPPFSEYQIEKPSEEAYETLVHEFWWDASYVPKHLWRDELPFAAQMLAHPLRDEYLRTSLDWLIGEQHGWSVNTGVGGRWLKRYLDELTWAEYTSTFAAGDVEAHWEAFFSTVGLFRRVMRVIGERLGYPYPYEVDRAVTNYCARIRGAEE